MAHNVKIIKGINRSIVDSSNNLVALFAGNDGNIIINKKKTIKFAPYGQGPSDLSGSWAFYNYKYGDIAIMDWLDKIKVFTLKKGTYIWK